jgi:hypothetical protein
LPLLLPGLVSNNQLITDSSTRVCHLTANTLQDTEYEYKQAEKEHKKEEAYKHKDAEKVRST